MGNRKWTNDELLERLRSLAQVLNKTPSWMDVKRAYVAKKFPCTPSNLCHRFRGYGKALVQAGYQANQSWPRSISSEDLLRELRTLTTRLERTPRRADVDLAYSNALFPVCSQTLSKRFGTYSDALRQAGVTDRAVDQRISNGELICELQKLSAVLQRSPSGLDTVCAARRGEFRYSHATYFKRLGNWHAALSAAGLPTRERLRLTRPRITAMLKEVARGLGYAPRISFFAKAANGLPSGVSIVHHFGSYNAALQAAGLLSLRSKRPRRTNVKKWTRDKLLSSIRMASEELGREPNVEFFRHANPKFPSYRSFYREFGSWPAALALARSNKIEAS